MRKNPVTTKAPAEKIVKDIRRATRTLHSSEENIRIVLTTFNDDPSQNSRSNCDGSMAEVPVITKEVSSASAAAVEAITNPSAS